MSCINLQVFQHISINISVDNKFIFYYIFLEKIKNNLGILILMVNTLMLSQRCEKLGDRSRSRGGVVVGGAEVAGGIGK